MKLLPGVRLMFAFHLYNGLLSAEEKRELFRILLSIFGIGAKTNTGYGQLVYTENHDIAIVKDLDTITCRDCGKIETLSDFEKEKIKNEGWNIIRCRECRKKHKQQNAGGYNNGRNR